MDDPPVCPSLNIEVHLTLAKLCSNRSRKGLTMSIAIVCVTLFIVAAFLIQEADLDFIHNLMRVDASVSIVDGKLTAAVEVKDNLSLVDLNSEDDVLEDWEFETDLAFFDRAFKAGQRMDAIMLHNECGSNRLPCMATF